VRTVMASSLMRLSGGLVVAYALECAETEMTSLPDSRNRLSSCRWPKSGLIPLIPAGPGLRVRTQRRPASRAP
jgi:hypothetical protein